jgi:pimeloyl-ACP methyl ester carboxylesterase
MALGEGVIGPARAAGYREVWLAGISLGAFNALHYAVDHPGDLAGIVLLAPYPGAGDVVAEMALAGGPIAWARTAPGQAEDERKWWRWLCQQSMTGHWQTAVYLGAGHEDRFFRGQSMLATLLPENHVRWIPGHHDWTTWQALWRHWLDNGPLSGRCP